MEAIRNANADVGAMVLELADAAYMVRGLGTSSPLLTSRTWW